MDILLCYLHVGAAAPYIEVIYLLLFRTRQIQEKLLTAPCSPCCGEVGAAARQWRKSNLHSSKCQEDQRVQSFFSGPSGEN